MVSQRKQAVNLKCQFILGQLYLDMNDNSILSLFFLLLFCSSVVFNSKRIDIIFDKHLYKFRFIHIEHLFDSYPSNVGSFRWHLFYNTQRYCYWSAYLTHSNFWSDISTRTALKHAITNSRLIARRRTYLLCFCEKYVHNSLLKRILSPTHKLKRILNAV